MAKILGWRVAIFTVALALHPLAAPGAAELGDAIDNALKEVVFVEVAIAPDGRQVAFITRRDDTVRDAEEFTLWRLDLEPPGAAPVRVTGGLDPLSGLRWSSAGALSYLAAGTDGAAQVFVAEPGAAAPRRLTDPARFQGGVDLYDWLPDGSGLIVSASDSPADEPKLKAFYDDVRRLPGPAATSSLYRIALAGGPAGRLGTTPFEESLGLAVSPDGRWIAVTGNDLNEAARSSQVELLPLGSPASPNRRRTAQVSWKESLAWAGKDLFVGVEGEEQGGRFVFTEGRLFRLGEGGRLDRVVPGLEGYLKEQVSLADGSLLVTTKVSTRTRVCRVEPGSGKVQILREHRGWLAYLSASRDSRRIAFVASDAQHYPEIYVARGPEGIASARPVTDFNAALTHGPLPEIETVSWDDGAGSTVEGVLFWPPGRKGEKGLPLAVDLHGGPFSVARTEAVSLEGSSLYFPALLAARGFLVLNPNSRGSAGRGDAFAQGINGHHCSRPSEDVIRGVESLIARGWADRARIGVTGYSGGGGLSKCLIGRTDLFRAVCTGSGVWDDVATFGTARGLMWTEAFYNSTPPWEDRELWRSESPHERLDRVKTPTLIFAGERDGLSPVQSEELYRGLVARGVPAELLVFHGEGHIFTKPSHKRTNMRAEISWLEHWLLGAPRADTPPGEGRQKETAN